MKLAIGVTVFAALMWAAQAFATPLSSATKAAITPKVTLIRGNCSTRCQCPLPDCSSGTQCTTTCD